MVEQDKLSAQVAVLGSLLLDPSLVGQALERVRPEDFTTPKCRMVFEAVRSLFTAGRPIDSVTVRDKLGGQPGDGWDQYLLEVMYLTPTTANVWEYAALMREQARMMRTVELAGLLQAAQSLEQVRGYVAQLNELMVERTGIQRMDMRQMLLDFADRHTTPHQYVTWGLPKLDGGLYVDMGDMVVLGGHPSAGKTALAVTFAYHQAKDHRVGFYSLETNRHKLADRLISNLAEIEMTAIKRGEITQDQWNRFVDQEPHIQTRTLELVEASGMTVQDIQADAMAHQYEFIYIDYLQLVEPESRRMNRTEQVSAISRGLQQLAHRTGRLVVALSQLTRAENTGKNEQVEPTMSNLRESGQIEQDADAIMLLYLEEPNRPDASRRVLKIAKNKEGTRGRIFLVFDGQFQRFRESIVDASAPKPKENRRKRQSQLDFFDLPGPGDEPVPFDPKP